MEISNAILSIIGAILNIIGVSSKNSDLSFFACGMVLVTFINVIVFALESKKGNT